jgi:hypothetical protein
MDKAMKKTTLFLCFFWLAGAALAKHQYVYSADQFRDPFVSNKAEETTSMQREFDPAGAQVKGLISTETGQIAVLRTAAGGSFIVKEGRLIDAAGNTAPGFYARITPSSVVVWTVDDTQHYAFPLKTSREGVSQ